jgi:hypothetical protein
MANPFDAVTKSLGVPSASDYAESLRAINDALMAESLAAMQSANQASAQSRSGDGSILDAVAGALGGGPGLSSLISGVAGLFGGGGPSVPAPPLPYIQPLSIELDAGFSASGGGAAFGADSAEGNAPRPITGSAPSSHITVQVQALDSQSFLDRSQDIAMAVRQAMLESTVLNDVIRGV